MIYIYAENANQAHAYARFKNIAGHDYRPIFRDGHDDLAGMRNPEVVCVGAWRNRGNHEIEMLRAHVSARGGRIIEDNSWLMRS